MSLISPAPSLVVQGGTVQFATEAAQHAERNGFHSAWTAELYHRSAIVSLTAMALGTSRIGLGSAVAWGFGRSPLTLATDARSIDHVSNGRLLLGIGSGGSPDWHGGKQSHPAARFEELVTLLRKIWRTHEDQVDYEGRFYNVWLPPDPTVPPPVNGTIPVLVGGMRPPMIRAAGAVADGLVGHPLSTPRWVAEIVRPALAEGAKRAGRDPELPIAGMLITAVDDDDPAKARDAAALTIAVYVSRGSVDQFLEFHGFQSEADAIMTAMKNRDMDGMKAAVSDRMLEEIAVFGTAEEARQRYRERFASVYERPLLYSPASRLPEDYIRENVHAICEAFKYEGRAGSSDESDQYILYVEPYVPVLNHLISYPPSPPPPPLDCPRSPTVPVPVPRAVPHTYTPPRRDTPHKATADTVPVSAECVSSIPLHSPHVSDIAALDTRFMSQIRMFFEQLPHSRALPPKLPLLLGRQLVHQQAQHNIDHI